MADNDAGSKPVESFETCLDELEQVVKQLEEAETRVEILIRKDGKIQPEPFRPASDKS